MDEARKHEILARLLRRNAALEREIARQAEGSKIVADRMKQMETCAIVIAGRFEHEGRRFGLAVPVFTKSCGTRTQENGADVVSLTRTELRILTRMLTDLGESWDITLAELEGKTHA